MKSRSVPTEQDRVYLERCVELALEALADGDEPFGSVLVSAEGKVIHEDRNRNNTVDLTRHPEFDLARWAAVNLTPEERAGSTVYTSGEHCPMCSAGHAWAGLGRIVYAVSADQLGEWYDEWGIEHAPVAALPINTIAPHLEVAGPDPVVSETMRKIHARRQNIAL